MKRLIALLLAVLSIAASAQERSAVANNVALWYDAFHKNDPALLDKILAEQWMDIPPAPGQLPGRKEPSKFSQSFEPHSRT